MVPIPKILYNLLSPSAIASLNLKYVRIHKNAQEIELKNAIQVKSSNVIRTVMSVASIVRIWRLKV